MKVLFACILATLVAGTLSSHLKAKSQIIAGMDATLGEFPYQAAILKSGHYHCSGSIYNEYYVISAAHCFVGSPNYYTVRVGTIDYPNGPMDGDLDVHHYVNHPQFSGYPLGYNDITLVRVNGQFTFSQIVMPISLPDYGNSFTDQLCKATGWGTISNKWPVHPATLQRTQLRVILDSICETAHNRDFKVRYIYSMLCAYIYGSNSAPGDSGGPLACDGVLAGVNSKLSFPDVYTEVRYYIDWIKSIAD